MKSILALIALFFAFSSPSAFARDAAPTLTPAQQTEVARLEGILESLKPQRGVIALPKADGTLNLGASYYFLDPADARKIIVDAWGNPPSNADGVLGVLGLIVPEGKTPYESWAAIVSYEQTDYVDDKDAKSADYDAQLQQVWDAEDEINKVRTAQGFTSMHVVGWAQPPSYDAQRHSMIWARDIRFAGEEPDTLNYDVRLLGRRGVLSLNMVATMPELASVREDAATLAKTASYNAGARYADFDPKSDKKASYGVAGLVAAGLGLAAAKKVGLLGLILLFAKKGIVIIVAFFAAIAGWFKRVFGGKSKDLQAPKRVLDLGANAPPPESESIQETAEKPET